MTLPTIKSIPNDFSCVQILIDSFQNELTGRFFNPYLGMPRQFHDIFTMIITMDKMMDFYGYPESVYRGSLEPKIEPQKRPQLQLQVKDIDKNWLRGKKATFQVRILTRLNSEWQGFGYCQETQKYFDFNTIFEMLHSIKSILEKL